MTSKSIRIIIVGPTGSGKSVFSEALYRALEDQGLKVISIDLDLWAETQQFLRGKISKNERLKRKRKDVSKEEIKKRAINFKKLSNDFNIVIGDAPGIFSDELEILMKPANFAIIVCREEWKKQIKDWKDHLEKNNVKLIGIVYSKISGKESVKSNELIEATIVDLDRDKSEFEVSKGTISFSTHLRNRFGI